MPIEIAKPICPANREEYHEIDHVVTGLAFEIQNEFGRLLDETLYQNELSIRCRAAGLTVDREAQVRVVHGSFSKNYYPDLLINKSVIVEVKCAEALAPAHQAQLLNYLFLCDLRHGTLLNFRSPKVEKRFVTASLSASERRRFTVRDDDWSGGNIGLARLKARMCEFLEDQGACLTTELYTEAMLHLCCGPGSKRTPIDVYSGPTIIGPQAVPALDAATAFHISALEETRPLESNLRRFLTHTRLKEIGWINLHRTDVTFKTLTNRNLS